LGKEPKDGYLEAALKVANNDDVINIYSDEGDDDYHIITKENIGPKIKIITGGSSLEFHKNIISGPVVHDGSETADFSLNYWGSPPNVEGNTGNVIQSPWLLLQPGTDNMVYMVGHIGADPSGSLVRAIADANKDTDTDTVLVNKGVYTTSKDEPVTESLHVTSTTGCPAHAFINGNLTLKAKDILLGKREELTNQGFTINADIRVDSGVDASTIHINWNDIYGTVTNDGVGRLDAQFNWWGDTEPEDSIVGDVDYEPYLPTDVCSFLAYMKENDLDNPVEAINAIQVSSGGGSSSSQQAVAQLISRGFSLSEAEDLLNELGLGRVNTALNGADDSGQLVELLGGYSLPVGASGGLTNNVVVGGAGSVGGKTVGAVFTVCDLLKIDFPLSDFQGNPAKDLSPTVSLVALDEDGNMENLEKVTTASYSDEKTAYIAVFSTCELPPGYYQVQIDLPDGSWLRQVIKVVGEQTEKVEG